MADDFSSPFKFNKPSDIFRKKFAGSNTQDSDGSSGSKKKRITLEDLSPLKCLESPQRKRPQLITIFTPPKVQGFPSPHSSQYKRRRLSLTPIKTTQTPSPSPSKRKRQSTSSERKSLKRQLNFGGIFSSPTDKGTLKSLESTSPSTSTDNKGQSTKKTPGRKPKGKAKEEPTTPSITSFLKPIPRTESFNKLIPDQPKVEIPTFPRTPIDWTLKTRIRFVAKGPKPFPFRGAFRAFEESTGITHFVRCLNASQPNGTESSDGLVPLSNSAFSPISHSQSMSNFRREGLDTSTVAVLRQLTMVWMFPHLPWLPLFPRIGASLSLSTGAKGTGSGNIPHPTQVGPAASDSLCRDFGQSLKSVFHLLKLRHCPFFYVCAPTFTCLFRGPGVGATFDVIHVLVTPTTSGFKNLLKNENIQFSCPFEDEMAEEGKNRKSGVDPNFNDEIILDDGDDDPEEFLGEIGLSQQDFPSLTAIPRKAKSCSKKLPSSDLALQRDTTLVVISGSDTQVFVNLLCQNVTKLGCAKTGILTGVPPTILSPVAFAGGTLRPHKIKSTSNNDKLEKTVTHVLEVLGPLLPTHVYNLSEHLRSTYLNGQESPCMVANLEGHSATAPFTLLNSLKMLKRSDLSVCSVFVQQSLAECGLPQQLVSDLCSLDLHSVKPIKDLDYKDKEVVSAT